MPHLTAKRIIQWHYLTLACSFNQSSYARALTCFAKYAQFLLIRCIMASRLTALAQKTFLSNRCNQGSILGKDQASSKTACGGCVRTVLGVKQPFIGFEWPMKPQCVVKACRHDGLFEYCAAVRDEGRIKEHQVRRMASTH